VKQMFLHRDNFNFITYDMVNYNSHDMIVWKWW